MPLHLMSQHFQFIVSTRFENKKGHLKAAFFVLVTEYEH